MPLNTQWTDILDVFQNSLPALKSYSLRGVYYTFSALAVNFGTHPRYLSIGYLMAFI